MVCSSVTLPEQEWFSRGFPSVGLTPGTSIPSCCSSSMANSTEQYTESEIVWSSQSSMGWLFNKALLSRFTDYCGKGNGKILKARDDGWLWKPHFPDVIEQAHLWTQWKSEGKKKTVQANPDRIQTRERSGHKVPPLANMVKIYCTGGKPLTNPPSK